MLTEPILRNVNNKKGSEMSRIFRVLKLPRPWKRKETLSFLVITHEKTPKNPHCFSFTRMVTFLQMVQQSKLLKWGIRSNRPRGIQVLKCMARIRGRANLCISVKSAFHKWHSYWRSVCNQMHNCNDWSVYRRHINSL